MPWRPWPRGLFERSAGASTYLATSRQAACAEKGEFQYHLAALSRCRPARTDGSIAEALGFFLAVELFRGAWPAASLEFIRAQQRECRDG